jgi:peptidoglycan/LPS O-acetylase OafA/YrhL
MKDAPARLDSLTGLRFVAALLVFFHHANNTEAGATLGSVLDRLSQVSGNAVSFFFMLSGFVLVWSRRPDDSARAFYRRRAARILPDYWVVWPIALAVVAWEGSVGSPGSALANLALLQAWVPVEGYYYGYNSVTWSLSVEVFFYLTFPLFVPSLLRLPAAARRVSIAGCVLFVLVLNASALGYVPHGGVDVVSWLQLVCPVTRLPEFLLGVLLALEVRDSSWSIGVVPAALVVAAALVLTASVGGVLGEHWVSLAPFGLLLVACARRDVSGAGSVLGSHAMIRLGEWSFALYLLHQLVIRAATQAGFGPDGTIPATVPFIAGTLAVSVALSALLYSLVERPAERRLRGGRGPRAQVKALA